MPLTKSPSPRRIHKIPPRDAANTIKALQLRVAELEIKLEDATELLHMWKGEACTYLTLAQAVVQGVFTPAKAKAMLARHVPLTPDARSRLKTEG